MFRVIRRKHWLRWCSRKGIDLDASLFSLDTCYYGAGIRSRPGTLVILPDRIVHYSYSLRDTLWALGERSIRVDLPFANVASIRKQQISFWLRVAQLEPQAHLRIRMTDGAVHDFFLQRDATAFFDALHTLGLQLTAE